MKKRIIHLLTLAFLVSSTTVAQAVPPTGPGLHYLQWEERNSREAEPDPARCEVLGEGRPKTPTGSGDDGGAPCELALAHASPLTLASCVRSAPVGFWNTRRSNSGTIARMWSKMSDWISS